MYSFTPMPLPELANQRRGLVGCGPLVTMLTEHKCVIAYEYVELNLFSTGDIFFRATFFLCRHHLHVKIDVNKGRTFRSRQKNRQWKTGFTTDINDMISMLSPWFVQNVALLSRVQCLTVQETNSSVLLPIIHNKSRIKNMRIIPIIHH